MVDKKRKKKTRKSKKKTSSRATNSALANSIIYKMMMRSVGAGYSNNGSGFNPQAQLNNQYNNLKKELDDKIADTKTELAKQRAKNEEFQPYAQLYSDLKERNRDVERVLNRKIDMMSGDLSLLSQKGMDLQDKLDMAVSKTSGKIKGPVGRPKGSTNKKKAPVGEVIEEVEEVVEGEGSSKPKRLKKINLIKPPPLNAE